MEYFPKIKDKIPYHGKASKDPLAFKYYNSEQIVAGKTMDEHLRFSVAYWHSFKSSGNDPFGEPGFFPDLDPEQNTHGKGRTYPGCGIRVRPEIGSAFLLFP